MIVRPTHTAQNQLTPEKGTRQRLLHTQKGSLYHPFLGQPLFRMKLGRKPDFRVKHPLLLQRADQDIHSLPDSLPGLQHLKGQIKLLQIFIQALTVLRSCQK